MSFRNRLILFFVLIVLVPMISMAVVLLRLISDNETGKADAALRAQQMMVINLYRQAVKDADRVLEDVSADRQLAEALREGDPEAARKRAQMAAGRPIARIRLVDDDGEEVFDVGSRDAMAPATGELVDEEGDSFGALQVSVTRAPGFKRRVARLVGTGLAVRADGRLLATSVEGVGDRPLPDVGTIEGPEGEDLRVASFDTRGFGSRRVVVSVLADFGAVSGAVTRSRLLAGAILLGFFILALAFALAVSRQLQQQVAGLLAAARRVGAGDFSTKVPTEGRDEFAALGEEFNKMSAQLAARLEELRLERERVQTSVRRLGQAVGSSLDRERLLRIIVATALEGVGAQGGRVMFRPAGDAPMKEAARVGNVGDLDPILRDVEGRVLRSGAFAEVTTHGRSALAHPLMEGGDQERRVHGVVSAARIGARFSDADRELFRYLAGQAAVSVENLDLHEAVARESVTDELTGLSNRRRFYEALELEAERSRRFGDPLGLVMIDIDDFKLVNDTWGHLQGDEVLREVGRVLRGSSREIDEPARYGGEELAVVLPGTDLDGAFQLAERIRTEIEALRIDALDRGRPLRITASCGVASLPEAAGDEQSLVAVADAALLQAKRAGKNRTVRAAENAPTQ